MIWIASLIIAFVIALVVTTLNRPIVSAQNLGAVSISLQTTPTLAAEGVSEIGSTDGIFIMGIVIILIVIVPVLFYRIKN